MKRIRYILLILPLCLFGQGQVDCSLLSVTDVIIQNDSITFEIFNADTMDTHYPYVSYTLDANGDTIQQGQMDLYMSFSGIASYYYYTNIWNNFVMDSLSESTLNYPLSIHFTYSNLTGENPGDYTCELLYEPQIDILTPCDQAQANATGLIGEFVPQCEEDGSFASTQCSGSTGYCWCVDEDGTEIPGTSIPSWEGTPDCSSTIDACTLSPESGMCFAAIQMYYFNQETQQCQDFTWGGCGGVVPFESLSECEAALCAQSGDNCCINPAWINPNAMCGMIWDPVIGCDGIEYSNSCVAQASGVSSWTDQSGTETILNWDCGDNPIALCTSPSGVEIFVEGYWENPADPCEMGECISTGEFVQIIVDCAEEMGMPCDGEWVEVEGQCCSECVLSDNFYCDSISLNPILPLGGVWDDSILVVNLETYFSNYSIPYAGLMLIDYMGDTIALETMSTAGNVYGIGPNTFEERVLLLVNELVFPFTGELCVVEGLFAGEPNIVCSYPVMWLHMGLNQIEKESESKLIKMLDVLGREQSFHQKGQLLFYIYDNGFVEKLIKY